MDQDDQVSTHLLDNFKWKFTSDVHVSTDFKTVIDSAM